MDPTRVVAGDGAQIDARDVLRVLVERDPEQGLPRHGPSRFAEREIAERFAQEQQLHLQLVYLEEFRDGLPALLEGRGDVLLANVTVTPEREAQVRFTAPLSYARDQLALPAGATAPVETAELRGVLGARPGTTLLETARALAAEHDGIQLVEIDAPTNDALVERMLDGEADAVLLDSNVLERLVEYRDDVAAGPFASEAHPLAWAVRPDAPELLTALNTYIAQYRLLGDARARYFADLDEIRERGRLRMMTTNNAATYFLWRGALYGFEYELGKRYAEHLGVRLEVVVVDSHDELLPRLAAGEGDFAAAFLAPTQRREGLGVAFTRPYHYASEVVVGDEDDGEVASLCDLQGRTITMRESSVYWERVAEQLAQAGCEGPTLAAAEEGAETQELIDAVARGEIDLTAADSHILDIEMAVRDDVQSLLNLGDEQPHGWAVHAENSALLISMNEWLASEYRGLEYNLSYRRYFDTPRHRLQAEDNPALQADQLSPWDDLVREHADEYGFAWQLIVAQMFQESRFDPEATSWAGAQGLMQVMPRTARELGIEDPREPEASIEAGIRYLDWVRDRFPAHLPVAERTWFALAGYNAGHGHVRDARRLAEQLGMDPDRWFDNVEAAMLKLEQREYHRHARYGYVRGREPVEYVRKIRDRYRAYVRLVGEG